MTDAKSDPVDRPPSQVVRIYYCNHRGDAAWRLIIPVRIRFAASAWHPKAQWLLDAVDLDKREMRTFALRDIEEWGPAP